jgi:hypothetical protein
MDDKPETGQIPPKPAESEPPEPSPPWFGAVILASLALATAWVLTYTLAPLPGQKALGGWNYAIVGVFLVAFIGLSMDWHGEPPDRNQG